MLVSWYSILRRQLAILKTTQLPSRDGQHHGWRIKLYDLTKHQTEYMLALYTALPVVKADTGVEEDGPDARASNIHLFPKTCFPERPLGTCARQRHRYGA